jgi:hypothetical protein
VKDLVLAIQRSDVCDTYPGYSVCAQSLAKIGFETTYPRPVGRGCDHVVEVRATDTDGNTRTIARRPISPINDR